MKIHAAMSRDEAIRMLRDAYRYVLELRADELSAVPWARTLGVLAKAKDDLIAERSRVEAT